MEIIDADVIVLGSGVAGLRAALELAKPPDGPRSIAILSKVQAMRSHSVAPEGGVAAVLSPGDTLDHHSFDTVKGSDYLADQDAVERFTAACPGEVLQLEHWGMPWLRSPEGDLVARRFGAHDVPRSYFAFDRTGFFLMKTLHDRAVTEEKIRIYHEYFVTEILVEDGRFAALVALERSSGAFVLFRARALILAAGGVGRIFSFATYSHTVTGDGIALAYRAGLALKDMEFVQWLPTTLVPSGIPATEALRGDGALLFNSAGERFMQRYAPNSMELAARDVVTRAMFTEIAEGRGVAGPRGMACLELDARPLGEAMIQERYKAFRENAQRFLSLDPVKERIPVRPAFHYSMGGVDVVDPSMATGTPGIWAAGEIACVSLHGANRLGTNSLPACLVTGTWAAQGVLRSLATGPMSSASARIVQRAEESVAGSHRFFERSEGDRTVYGIRTDLYAIMDAGVGVFRTAEGLRNALTQVRALTEAFRTSARVSDRTEGYNLEWLQAHEVRNQLLLAESILVAALWREESRGSHFRSDFPKRDDVRFLRHSLVTLGKGGPELTDRAARITRWPPQERKY
jgi:succinate dehydrogenase / fumarate reductase flavoprotein subunit